MRETWADIPLGIKGSGGKQDKSKVNKTKVKRRKIKGKSSPDIGREKNNFSFLWFF